MVYQPLHSQYCNPGTILDIYGSDYTQNISSKFFDLAWNQLLSKKAQLNTLIIKRKNSNSYNYSYNYNCNIKIGVFMYKTSKFTHMIVEKTILPLANELLQLPNHQYCYRYSNNSKEIWILNNDGKAYENIDWNNMDWTTLINNLNCHVFYSIIDCIECCIKNNQLMFLKKVIYFTTKMDNESNVWPKYMDEYAMLQLRKYKKTFSGHEYFINQILQICAKQHIECKKNYTMKNISYASLVTIKLDSFVENVVIPKIKSQSCKKIVQDKRDLLKQQTNWCCYLCKNVNEIVTKVCPHCEKNESLCTFNVGANFTRIKSPLVLSLNPYQAFIENESTLFNINNKSFGVIQHRNLVDLTTGNTQTIDFEYPNKTVISIVFEIKNYRRVSILFDIRNALTIGELKIVLYELVSQWNGSGKYRELLYVSFDKHEKFSAMTDSDIIPQSKDCKPYSMDNCNVQFYHAIRKKHRIHFGKNHCNFQCPFMIAAKLKFKSKDMKLDPFKHCPYFSDKFDNSDDNRDKALDHLTSYDHFVSFDIVQNDCGLKDKCPHYQRALKSLSINQINLDLASNKQSIFQDKKHSYLYCHPTLKIKNNFAFKNGDSDNINSSIKWYDCIPQPTVNEIQSQYVVTYTNESFDQVYDPQGVLLVARLIREVVTNNYIKDLLPKTQANSMFGDKNYVLNQLEIMKNEWWTTFSTMVDTVDKNTLIENMKRLQTKFSNFLSNTFAIFQILTLKMNHSRHKKMGCPLSLCHMLALVLYCNGDCSYDLCLSQRNSTYLKKWPMFDCFLNLAIYTLSQFEEHWENIYSGICNVFYQFKDSKYLRESIYFRTNVSFTTDLKIAKQFRGSTGMIIGLNIQRSFAAMQGRFHACDVSWISKYPNEKEVLVQRGSEIRIYPNKMTQTQTKDGEKQQWFVCDEGNLQETSFQSMFC